MVLFDPEVDGFPEFEAAGSWSELKDFKLGRGFVGIGNGDQMLRDFAEIGRFTKNTAEAIGQGASGFLETDVLGAQAEFDLIIQRKRGVVEGGDKDAAGGLDRDGC